MATEPTAEQEGAPVAEAVPDTPQVRYLVRLEAPGDSEHYRETVLHADSAEAAQAICEQKERDICAFRLDEGQLAEIALEQEEAGGVLRGPSKGKIFAHEQTEPYTVSSVREL